MKDAIKLSLGTMLSRDLRTSIHHLCGQFLHVDKYSQVQVIHETARAFLTMDTLDSELRVVVPQGHEMIAAACLKYLASDDLKFSKRRRQTAVAPIKPLSIADYACLRFGEHLLRASSSSDQIFKLLTKLFTTNVLSWIELVAQLGDLDCVIRTARHLTQYLERRAKRVPIISADLYTWAIDLPRITTQFNLCLMASPMAIHTLIPPFCPRNSAIFRQFGCPEGGIKLLGACEADWEERIFTISHHDALPSTVTTLDDRFAVGLTDGRIKLYRTSTCEELTTLVHGSVLYAISILQFDTTSRLLASVDAGGFLKLWDTVEGKELFIIGTESRILALAFNETESLLFLASEDKYVSSINTTNGSLQDRFAWTDIFIENDGREPQRPRVVKISIEQQAMAVVHGYKSVQLWCFEKKRSIGPCLPRFQPSDMVLDIAFNPNPDYQRVVVSYLSGILAVYLTKTCKPLVTTNAHVNNIAITPNGKTIAGSSDGYFGGIKIYDSETLQFLHMLMDVRGRTQPLNRLVFTTDSLRIIDTNESNTNVWEPAILVRQNACLSTGKSDDPVHQSIKDLGAPLIHQPYTITTFHCCEENEIVFCGHADGQIVTHSLDDPEKAMRNLYAHDHDVAITHFDWASKPRIAVSTDIFGYFRVMQITAGTQSEWRTVEMLRGKAGPALISSQALVNSTGTLVLVSTSESASIWSVPDKIIIAHIKLPTERIRKWIRASNPSHLLLFEGNTVTLYEWTDLRQLGIWEVKCISAMHEDLRTRSVVLNAIPIQSGGNDLVVIQREERATTSPVYFFDLLTLEHDAPLQPMLTNGPAIFATHVLNTPNLDYIIGTVKIFNAWCLLFVSTKGWVFSVELMGGSMGKVQRHFFVPFVWKTRFSFYSGRFRAKVLRNHDVVFAHSGGVTVVKNGLDVGEFVSIDEI